MPRRPPPTEEEADSFVEEALQKALDERDDAYDQRREANRQLHECQRNNTQLEEQVKFLEAILAECQDEKEQLRRELDQCKHQRMDTENELRNHQHYSSDMLVELNTLKEAMRADRRTRHEERRRQRQDGDQPQAKPEVDDTPDASGGFGAAGEFANNDRTHHQFRFRNWDDNRLRTEIAAWGRSMDRSIAALRRLEQNHADDMRYNNQFIYWAWQINRCRDRIIQYQQELQLRQVEYAEQQRYRRRQRKDDDDDEPQSGGITAAGSFGINTSGTHIPRELAYRQSRFGAAALTPFPALADE